MSMPLGRHFSTEDHARVQHAVDEAKRKVEERQHAIANLPLMQKIALLKMNRSTLSRGVASKLIAEEAFDEHPSYGDYIALAKLGLCERPEDGQFHEITAQGCAHAFTITKAECKRLKIHVPQDGGLIAGGDCRWSCSCGEWDWKGRAGANTYTNMSRAFQKHYVTATGVAVLKAGLKPPTIIAEG